MTVTSLVLSILALLIALIALGVAAAVRLSATYRRIDGREHRRYAYGPREERPGAFSDGFPGERRPWDGGPRC